MAAGTAPDVIDVQDEPFAAYSKMGQFEDLGPYVRRGTPRSTAPDRFFPTALETFRVNGKQYGLPWNGGQLMIYYNRTLFREAGLPDPPPRDWTWKEWLEACRKLTRDWTATGGSTSSARGQRQLHVQPAALGLDVRRRHHRSGDEALHAGHARRAPDAAFLRDLIYRHHVAPRSSEFTGMGGNVMFMTGRLGMQMNGVWDLPFMRQTDIDWDVTFLPRGPAGRFSRGTWDGVAMYRKSRHKEAAWRFIQFATGERGQFHVAQTGRAIPPRKSQAYSPPSPGRTRRSTRSGSSKRWRTSAPSGCRSAGRR